jgi:hypothetical protein
MKLVGIPLFVEYGWLSNFKIRSINRNLTFVRCIPDQSVVPENLLVQAKVVFVIKDIKKAINDKNHLQLHLPNQRLPP